MNNRNSVQKHSGYGKGESEMQKRHRYLIVSIFFFLGTTGEIHAQQEQNSNDEKIKQQAIETGGVADVDRGILDERTKVYLISPEKLQRLSDADPDNPEEFIELFSEAIEGREFGALTEELAKLLTEADEEVVNQYFDEKMREISAYIELGAENSTLLDQLKDVEARFLRNAEESREINDIEGAEEAEASAADMVELQEAVIRGHYQGALSLDLMDKQRRSIVLRIQRKRLKDVQAAAEEFIAQYSAVTGALANASRSLEPSSEADSPQ